jgi:hypothetical protein
VAESLRNTLRRQTEREREKIIEGSVIDGRNKIKNNSFFTIFGGNAHFQVNVMKTLCKDNAMIIDASHLFVRYCDNVRLLMQAIFSYVIVITSDFCVSFYFITIVSIFIQQPKLGLRSVI